MRDHEKLVWQKRSGKMITTAAYTQEERRRLIGWENFTGVLLSGTTTADPMAQSQSHAKERPTKKRPGQHIEHGIVAVETVY